MRQVSGDMEALGRLLDVAPDPMLVLDARAEIQFSNRNAGLLFGYAADQLLGEPVTRLIPSWDLAMMPAAPDEGQVSPGATYSVLDARGQDGREFAVEVSMSSACIDGQATFPTSVRDVTARIRREQETDRMRDELIANISHELRTPLTSIIGYIEILHDFEENELGPRARRLVDVIARNANRELRLVNDLLTMAFVDQLHDRLTLEPVQLIDIGRRVVEACAPMAAEAGLVLVLEAGADPTVRGDAHRLVQMLENLVVNSCKFTPRGGHVFIRVDAVPGIGVLEVSDTGIGVAAEELERLFDRMYRAPRAVDNQTQGTGLGLAIAKGIADAHGARITVDSEVDVGTTVRVLLPEAAPRA